MNKVRRCPNSSAKIWVYQGSLSKTVPKDVIYGPFSERFAYLCDNGMSLITNWQMLKLFSHMVFEKLPISKWS